VNPSSQVEIIQFSPWQSHAHGYEVLALECPVLLGFAALFGLLAVFSARLLAKGPGAGGK